MQGHNMVSWRDYEGVDGHGQATVQDMVELQKALSAGSAINAPATAAGEGFPLRVESLERTLKNTTYRMEHVRLWKAIPKVPAFNTVEEYNRVTSYGAADQGAFMVEGELPSETDATYERVYAAVKFLGTTRRVTHVMSLVKPAHGNVIAQETVAGTMYLLRQLERALFYADSSLDANQFDGFEALIANNAPATHIIDMRGAPLTEDALIDAALTIQNAPAYGTPTHLHVNPAVKADLIKSFFPKARYDLMEKREGMVGMSINGFTSPAGDVRFEPNVFIDDGGVVPAGAVGSGAIPGAPALTVAPAAGGAGTAPLWTAGAGDHDVGAYIWRIVAANRFGQSASTRFPAAGTFTPTAGASVTMTVTGDAATTYFKVYRTLRAGADLSQRLIFRQANPGGGVVVTDINARLPRTTTGFMFQQDNTNMSFAQLAPMIKVPLAITDTSIRWMQLIYGTPKLYTPNHNVLFRNIGRATDFVGTP